MAGRLCPTCGREMVLQKVSNMGSKPGSTPSEQRMSSGDYKWVCPRDGTVIAVGQE